MGIYKIILIAIAAAIGSLLLFMIIRTLCIRPKKTAFLQKRNFNIDKDKIAEDLSGAIQIPTVSMVEEYVGQDKPFKEFHDYLKKTFPIIHQTAELTVINGYSLVYRFKGTDDTLLPACFLAHQDVVPATDAGWDYPPFSGKITDDGYIYGRGALDMKNHLIALLEAMETLLKNGQTFERDVYFCFGHDEEPGTSFEGAPKIVEYFIEKGIKFEFVLDEGGIVLDGKMLGVNKLLAMIGICEKGNSDFELVVRHTGGHASNPKRKTAVGMLAKALVKLQKHPMKTKWTSVTKDTFKAITPYAKGPLKFVLANRDIFSPLVKKVLTVADSMTNALVRTTFAPTMIWSAEARNILPNEVRVNVNTRIMTGETDKDVIKHLKKVCGKNVEVVTAAYTEPTPVSDIKSHGYVKLQQTISEMFDNTVAIPYMFIAASDARFYSPVSDNVFRFAPFINGKDDQPRIHGINERTTKDAMEKATQFFANFIINSCCKNSSET